MARRRISQYAVLLLLLSSSCAWAANDSPSGSERDPPGSTPRETKTISYAKNSNLEAQAALETITTELGSAMTKEEAVEGPDPEGLDVVIPPTGERVPASSQDDTVGEQELKIRRRSTTPSSSPTQEEVAQITPAPLYPLLAGRQAAQQGQIDQLNARIQSLQQSAQQALQSLSDQSRAVSAASQSLSQSSQEQSRQSLSLSSQSSQLANNLQFATITINSLNGALTSAISSGSSAFASCTNSASSLLAKASNDAATQVGSALAQATVARQQADQQVTQAQNTAISITQAAAAIVGTFIGSSALTILLVFIILRYKRNKRRSRNRNDDDNSGGYYGDEKQRPRTRDQRPASYNSMVGAARDVKDLPRSPSTNTDFGLGTGTTRVGSPPGQQQQQQAPLPKLGILRKATGASNTTNRGGGEALSTDYLRRADSTDRKPVMTAMKLSEPPPAKQKKAMTSNNANTNDGSGAAVLRVFPKVDPDPKGLLSVPQQQQQGAPRPGSEQQAENLQKWLSTATVSPFGPLDDTAGPKVGPGPSRLAQSSSSSVWPLQEPMTAYLETPTVETATVARSMSGSKGNVKGVMGLPANPRRGP